jgi:hypothetical protein
LNRHVLSICVHRNELPLLIVEEEQRKRKDHIDLIAPSASVKQASTRH